MQPAHNLIRYHFFSLMFMHNNQVPCGRRLHFKIISSSMMTTYRTLFLDNYRRASHIEFQQKTDKRRESKAQSGCFGDILIW